MPIREVILLTLLCLFGLYCLGIIIRVQKRVKWLAKREHLSRNWLEAMNELNEWQESNPFANQKNPEFLRLLKTATFHLKQFPFFLPEKDPERERLLLQLTEMNNLLFDRGN